MKADAHPGVPFQNLGNKNSVIYKNHYDLLVDMTVEQLIRQAAFADIASELSATDFITFGLWDPIRLFVKDEPHTTAKLAAGRLRLISNVSIRTQTNERVTSSHQNDKEINNWYNCPAKPGMGLDDMSFIPLTRTFIGMLRRGKVAMTDVQAWDWSVKLWTLLADAERRRIAMNADREGFAAALLKLQAHATSKSVYALPNGELVESLDAGIQNSGSYKTSSTNSWMRLIVRLVSYILVELDNGRSLDEIGDAELNQILNDAAAMGDDCVEGYLEGVPEKMTELGYVVKMCEVVDSIDQIEFCSHQWTDEGLAYPTSMPRTLFRFFSQKLGNDSPDRLARLDFDSRHHPKNSEITGYAAAWVEQANKNTLNNAS